MLNELEDAVCVLVVDLEDEEQEVEADATARGGGGGFNNDDIIEVVDDAVEAFNLIRKQGSKSLYSAR